MILRRLSISVICALLLAFHAFAQVPMTGAGLGAPVAAGGGCTAATNFLARTSGLSGTETTAYTNMICGLVTDNVITGNLSGAAGCGSVLDGLYFWATNTTTTANLNLCGTSFGITANNAPTFTADRGYTGNSTNTFLDPAWQPSVNGVNFTQNSAHFMVCNLSNRTSANNSAIAGIDSGATQTYIYPYAFAGSTGWQMNSGNFNNPAATTALGTWVATRTDSTHTRLDRNGSAVDTQTSDTSNGLPGNKFMFLAAGNNAGGADSNTGDQLGAGSFGGALTPTLATALRNRISAALTAVGGSGC